MSSRRSIILGLVCSLSLMLAIAIGVGWRKSFDGKMHLVSFARSGERVTLGLHWGQFILWGPARDRVGDAEAALARQMSNGDFDWQAMRAGYAEGVVREGSPTWKAYEKFRARGYVLESGEPMTGRWLEVMEDPARFLPAHMMLLNAAEEKRNKYFHRSSRFPEASFMTSPTGGAPEDASQEPQAMKVTPVLYFVADASGKGPDLSLRAKLCREWHDVLDEKRGALFVGWPMLALLTPPLVWIARPRWRALSWRRWIWNAAVLLSAITFAAAVAMWVRSYWVGDEFQFFKRPRRIAEWPNEVQSVNWIGSEKGRMMFFRMDLPSSMRITTPPGYHRRSVILWLKGFSLGSATKGVRHWDMSGFSYESAPPQRSQLNNGRGGFYLTDSAGVRLLELSWWVVVAVSLILPLIWARGEIRRWVYKRREKKLAGKICLKCGYDMRVTPQRCPECGAIPPEITKALSARSP